MSRLERFRSAQDSPHAGFAAALAEIRAGGKRGHWIWYVLPQIAGLGSSALSHAYAIEGEEEAADYLHDPELRSRLLTIATAVAEALEARETTSLRQLMGSDTDARKLVSSLTLFGRVARKLHASGVEAVDPIATVAERVLVRAAAEGYPPCAYTLRRLGERPP